MSKSKLAVHFSSNSSEWETPGDLFLGLDEEFHFTLDVCATPENTKCRRYISPEKNALLQPWHGSCWMNPPYGRSIGLWVKKAWHEQVLGHAQPMVALLPARTDTQWWHDYVMRAYERRFLKGRITFVGAYNPAPFPSVIVVF